ncbi:MAG: ABC transporter ATP-binding protein [Desulfomonilaceae bacterium]|jgi:ATP-binding cassette subfamily B protein
MTTDTTTDPQPTLRNLLLRLWRHLSKRRQRQLGLLLVLMVASAFSEVISLGAVLPFIGILTAPENVFNNASVKSVCESFGITSASQLVLPLTVIFVCAAFLAGGTKLLLLWAGTQISNGIGADLSFEVYRRTLYQPYRTHMARNSSEVIDGIANKSWSAVLTLQSVLTLISSVLLLLALLMTLVVIDPLVVSVAFVVFGISYGSISWGTHRQLQINSWQIARENVQRFKALQEGLGGIRDVLLNGTQRVYCDTYRRADLPYRKAYGSNVFIAACPRFAMEAVGIALIAGLAYGLSRQAGGVATALPVLGALALGAQRLMPAIQQSYTSWASIAGNKVSLSDSLEFLDQPLPAEATTPDPTPLEFKDVIQFDSVYFHYLSNGPSVLDCINITIFKGSRVGLVGTTGSGKSTLLDLLMGLLEPTEGQILVDGLAIAGERRRSWQRSIAHVPQSIFLADTTIAENIALGVPRKAIDMDRVREAARQAQIAKFIESRKNGYNEFVGERGIRLSGGQRQRIGIARALYRQASVLVFDEATSSLDNATEQAVMESIERLNRDLTILIIAHRLTTVQRCDEIIELEYGRVVAQGTYEQLRECSPSFRRMATAVA